MRNHLLLALGLATAPLALGAEPSKSAESAKASVTVRCRVLAIGKAPAQEVYVKRGSTYRPIFISTDSLSNSFRTEAKDGIIFYHKIPGGDIGPDGKKKKDAYVPFAQCAADRAPGSASDSRPARQIVFLMNQGKDWKAVAKSDHEGAFPVGTRLVFNLFPKPVMLDYGGTKLGVEPGRAGLLQVPQKTTDNMAQIRMARRMEDGSWGLFYNTVWLQVETQRKIVFVYPESGDASVPAVTSIPDAVESEDEEEKQAAEEAKSAAGKK